MNILVTGGAGYIGSHVVKKLKEAEHSVTIIDTLEYGHRDIVENILRVPLIQGSIGDEALLNQIFTEHSFDAVMHFSSYIEVGESVRDPGKYYANNTAATLTLLNTMIRHKVPNFVFSSTAAVYGLPQEIPIKESHALSPINPYGHSKLMVEQFLRDFAAAHDFHYTVFRYFNASGADPSGDLGEDHNPESHLIPLTLLHLLGHRDSISIYGTDYDTPDGTCVRDYIHVSDLADAHILGLEKMIKDAASAIFNLGNGKGFSVKEIIDTAERVTGLKANVKITPRREGDPPFLVGSAEKAINELGWSPRLPSPEDIISTAWNWHQKRHGKK